MGIKIIDVRPVRDIITQHKEAQTMMKQDKVLAIFGIGLIAVVDIVVFFISISITT
jgi:hypothetical protein